MGELSDLPGVLRQNLTCQHSSDGVLSIHASCSLLCAELCAQGLQRHSLLWKSVAPHKEDQRSLPWESFSEVQSQVGSEVGVKAKGDVQCYCVPAYLLSALEGLTN